MSGMRLDRGSTGTEAYLTVELDRGSLAIFAYSWPAGSRLASRDPGGGLIVTFLGPRGGDHGTVSFNPDQADDLRGALLNMARWNGGRANCPGLWSERITLRRRQARLYTIVSLFGPKSCRYMLAATADELTDVAAAIRFCIEEVRQ